MTVVEGYRSPQVCATTGITFRQLDYWDRVGVLTPSVTQTSGSGTWRRYSRDDMCNLTIIRTLVDAGMSLNICRRVVEALAGDRLSLVAVTPAKVYRVNTNIGLVQFLHSTAEPVVVVNVGKLDRQVGDLLDQRAAS